MHRIVPFDGNSTIKVSASKVTTPASPHLPARLKRISSARAVKICVFILKAILLTVPTFLIIYLTGTVLLTAIFGILTGTPRLFLSRDLAGVPFIYYALVIALPIAIVASAFIWGAATMFAAIGQSGKRLISWLAFFAVIGLIIGSISAIPVVAAGASEIAGRDSGRIIAAYIFSFGFVGVLACTVVAPLWFFTFQEKFSF